MMRSLCKRRTPGLLLCLLIAAAVCVVQVTLQIKGHTDDVNAIAYLDDSNNILISGSDDKFVKVHVHHIY